MPESLPDSVAKRITRQTSDRKDCGSNSPGGECIYNSNQKEDGREKYNIIILDPFYLNGLRFGSKKFIYIKKGIKYIKNESLKLQQKENEISYQHMVSKSIAVHQPFLVLKFWAWEARVI